MKKILLIIAGLAMLTALVLRAADMRQAAVIFLCGSILAAIGRLAAYRQPDDITLKRLKIQQVMEIASFTVPLQWVITFLKVLKTKLMKENSFYALAVRPPTVPQNTCRVRISLNSEIGYEDLEKLIEIL